MTSTSGVYRKYTSRSARLTDRTSAKISILIMYWHPSSFYQESAT